MDISEPRLRALLTQAERNADYGKLAAAETLYRQILEEAPEAEEAWLGLADVLSDPAGKREAYEQALLISADNPRALEGLARLNGDFPVETIDPPVADPIEVDLAPAVAPATGAAITPDVTAHVHVIKEDAYEQACYRHPDRLTSLRCYQCGKPICINCANKTPVGYMCPDCVRQAEDAFFNNKPTDYLIAALVSFPISLLAGWVMVNFQFGLFFLLIIFFVAGAIGSFIGRITKRAIGNRRGRYLPQLVVAMMILGVLIPALPILLGVLLGNVGVLTALIAPVVYLVVASGAAYWQMR